MSKAFKCDRCGKLYEGYRGIQLTDHGNYYNIMQFVGGLGAFREYDLCPDCMQLLVTFITEGKTER